MLGIQSLRLLRSGRAAGYWTRRSVIPGAFKTMTGDTSTAPAVNAAEVHVRPAAAADASSLASIINEAYRTTRGWTHEAHLVGGERISAAGVQEIISAGRDALLVCEAPRSDAGRPDVVGCICAEWGRHHPDTGIGESACMLGLIAVEPAWQSRGIGTRLLRSAMAHAHDVWHCDKAVMWVIKQRADIIEWYGRLGFRPSGETRPFVFPELQLLPEVAFDVLERNLP